MTALATGTLLRIEARGAPLGERALRTVVQATVIQRVNVPTLCELTLVDSVSSGASPAIAAGDELRLFVAGHDGPLFEGEVTAITHRYGPTAGRELRVRAYDALHRLRVQRRLKVYVQVSTSELFTEMLAPLGLAVECAETDPTWPRLVQVACDDLAFLTRAAQQRGLWFWLDGTTLRLMSAAGMAEEVELRLGRTLLETTIEHNLLHECDGVQVSGYSAEHIEPHAAHADQPRTARGATASMQASPSGTEKRRVIANATVRSDEQARTLAQAELDAACAARLVCSGTAAGDPLLRPGVGARIRGVAPELEGVYTLTGVTHRVTATGGYVCDFTSAPPASSMTTGIDDAGTLLTVGVVRSVSDPDRLGRIQVSLMVGEELESDWMGVVFPGAGDSKGLIALPDVGDHVLVLMPRDITGQGIVLGGLYARRGLPDGKPSGGGVKRFAFLTPGGQRLSLDDSNGTLVIENSSGSKVQLSPETVKLHSVTDLVIEAPGRKILIRGSRIDFEEG